MIKYHAPTSLSLHLLTSTLTHVAWRRPQSRAACWPAGPSLSLSISGSAAPFAGWPSPGRAFFLCCGSAEPSLRQSVRLQRVYQWSVRVLTFFFCRFALLFAVRSSSSSCSCCRFACWHGTSFVSLYTIAGDAVPDSVMCATRRARWQVPCNDVHYCMRGVSACIARRTNVHRHACKVLFMHFAVLVQTGSRMHGSGAYWLSLTGNPRTWAVPICSSFTETLGTASAPRTRMQPSPSDPARQCAPAASAPASAPTATSL